MDDFQTISELTIKKDVTDFYWCYRKEFTSIYKIWLNVKGKTGKLH